MALCHREGVAGQARAHHWIPCRGWAIGPAFALDARVMRRAGIPEILASTRQRGAVRHGAELSR